MKYTVYTLLITLILNGCGKNDDSNASGSGHDVHKNMKQIKKNSSQNGKNSIELNALLKPTNEFVVSTISVISLQTGEKKINITGLGIIDYDTRQIGNIAARVSGRIEKLYIRDKYQKVVKGQKVMEIYSPELMDAQQDLLFLLKNDKSNQAMIAAARQKLLLLGMSSGQLQSITKRGTPDFTVFVYSSYTGHVHEAGTPTSMKPKSTATNAMPGSSSISLELPIKEGMYVQKGQTVFSVFDPNKAWVSLNIFSNEISIVKKGQLATVIPEVNPNKKFVQNIGFIEPFFRTGNKTLTARIYFDNSRLGLPIGSQVKSEIASKKSSSWLPKEAVVSLGLSKVVFKKVQDGFIASKIISGIETDGYVEILEGISQKDSVAGNAQYLMDSESFIRTKN